MRWSPKGEWIALSDGGKLRVVSPNGTRRRVLAEGEWLTYGWSKAGDAMLLLGVSAGRRLAGAASMLPPRQSVVANLGPAPAALQLAWFQDDFPNRGFSLSPDGNSFLTSALKIHKLRVKSCAY